MTTAIVQGHSGLLQVPGQARVLLSSPSLSFLSSSLCWNWGTCEWGLWNSIRIASPLNSSGRMGILWVHGGVSQVSNNFPLLGKQLYSWPPSGSSAVILHCHSNIKIMRQEVPNAHPASLIPCLSQVSDDYQETQRFFAAFPENQHCFDGRCCNLFPLILPNSTSTQYKSLVGFELGWQQASLLFQLTLGDTRFIFLLPLIFTV